jgi:hypothetical protein
MNFLGSKTASSSPSSFLRLPMRWWRRFQVWRGLKTLGRADHRIRHGMAEIEVGRSLRTKAAKLIGKNAVPPNDLFDVRRKLKVVAQAMAERPPIDPDWRG